MIREFTVVVIFARPMKAPVPSSVTVEPSSVHVAVAVPS